MKFRQYITEQEINEEIAKLFEATVDPTQRKLEINQKYDAYAKLCKDDPVKNKAYCEGAEKIKVMAKQENIPLKTII